MSDVHSIEVRSFNMSRIRSKDTKPEMLVRQYLYKHGYRYRVGYKKLPGSPDLAFISKKKVIFVHGCFWHGHEGCKLFSIPKTRTEWWEKKINANRKRDHENTQKLEIMGWKAISIFECGLKKNNLEETLRRIVSFLDN